MPGEVKMELKVLPGGQLPMLLGPDVRVDIEEIRDRARHRYETDAEFHYRCKATHRLMSMALADAPQLVHVVLIVFLDEHLRKENGLR